MTNIENHTFFTGDEEVHTNNFGLLIGVIKEQPKFSHIFRQRDRGGNLIYEEKFYEASIETKRASGTSDIIPIYFGENTHNFDRITKDNIVRLCGEFRSRNQIVDEHSRLMLSFFAKKIDQSDLEEMNGKDANMLKLRGYICKPPVFRTTPFNREICDLLVAVNGFYNKSNYIPCLAWGRNARFASGLPIGTRLELEGRIQSRPYEKKTEQGLQERVAYEVSISMLSAVEVGSHVHKREDGDVEQA